jgi:hypothetical protein
LTAIRTPLSVLVIRTTKIQTLTAIRTPLSVLVIRTTKIQTLTAIRTPLSVLVIRTVESLGPAPFGSEHVNWTAVL